MRLEAQGTKTAQNGLILHLSLRPDKLEEFSRLYDQHLDQVRGILFRFGIQNPSEMEDLLQEVFLKIWKGLSFFRRNSKTSTWIYRIAVRTAIDRLRAQARKPKTVPVPESFSDSSNNNPIENREAVQKMLQELSLEHRTVLVLHVMQGYSLREVSQLTDLPLGTVKSRLHHARENAKTILNRLVPQSTGKEIDHVTR